MTDSDARLRNRLRWAIHGLLVVGLTLVLLLLTLFLATDHGRDATGKLEVLGAIWGFWVVYAAGTTLLVGWKATTWLHALLVHVAGIGSILLGLLVIAGVFVAGVRDWHF